MHRWTSCCQPTENRWQQAVRQVNVFDRNGAGRCHTGSRGRYWAIVGIGHPGFDRRIDIGGDRSRK